MYLLDGTGFLLFLKLIKPLRCRQTQSAPVLEYAFKDDRYSGFLGDFDEADETAAFKEYLFCLFLEQSLLYFDVVLHALSGFL